MKRKSFFGKLREKQLLERVRNDRRSQGKTSSAFDTGEERRVKWMSTVKDSNLNGALSSHINDFDMGNISGDKDDIWSFQGRSMEINLASPSIKSCSFQTVRPSHPHGSVRLDPEVEELIQPHVSTKDSYLHKIINLDRKNLSTGTDKLAEFPRRHPREFMTGAGRKPKATCSLSNFKTPEKESASQLIEDGPGTPKSLNDEIRSLESSIIMDNSPSKLITKKRKRRRKRYTSPTLTTSPKNDVASQNHRSSQFNEHLSDQISEYQSTQSLTSSPIVRTPMSEWIHQDTATLAAVECHDPEEIETLDSPKHKRLILSTNRRNLAPTASTSSSLLQSLTTIKARYDTSVRLFAHDLRTGKYKEEKPLCLFIRKIIDRYDRMVLTVAYDLEESKDRKVLFRQLDSHDITEGACIKLYPPWQELPICDSCDSVIIGTDFYKCVSKSKLNLSEQSIEAIYELPLPSFTSMRINDPLFMDMVPYHIKNKNTVRNYISQCQTFMDIDVAILYSWTDISPVLFLLKDSDEFLSFLLVPKDNIEVVTKLQSEKYFRLRQVSVAKKITTFTNLSPFSVLDLFGGKKQSFFYYIKWEIESQCTSLMDLDIADTDMKSHVVNIDEIYTTTTSQDHRISLKCKIKEKEKTYILVRDSESDRSLRIEFVSDPEFQEKNAMSFENEATVLLKFLRVIYGKVIWDCFTTCEHVLDEDDSFDF